MKPLDPIEPSSIELAGLHARRLIRAINDTAQVIANVYKDHPSLPARSRPNKQTGVADVTPATPPVTKADIQARLGPQNLALVEGVIAALSPGAAVGKE